ncbi:CehA/McbA family metallohydrolase [Paenibacillus spongiae]|uniref:CehA/McbA family metallohydrolase n=1 Tax=Paenibacillus spongiae TaxID=2909671 RepID=A0ABY5SBD7_9BACL|nr:CehA/McbA family metallohydrolase [Paenibacillus spongiae]UVI31266.1 CehA/McbA family metallohydrolase [Paenibacillus spongiae]
MTQENNTIIWTIERVIAHEEQDTYVEVPFDMPERSESVRVSYEVSPLGDGRCVVDLGIKDADGIRGWSGGARKEFVLGLDNATPGYMRGKLQAGTGWAVVLGAYAIPPEGCRVTVRIECQLEFYRWLKGDLHTHSVHSDGSFTLEEKVRLIEEMNGDFVALTDHNTTSQNLAAPRATSVVTIPGMELTTYYGHCNFLGVDYPIRDFRANTAEQAKERIREARSNGAKIVLNHPHCRNCGWHWGFDVEFDWVEIWNGPWREDNRKTLDWWQGELASGKKIVAVGGSDVHRPEAFVQHCTPTTWTYSPSRSVEGILQSIDLGRVFLTYAPEGPTIHITSGPYVMGDTVCLEDIRLNGEDAANYPVQFELNQIQPGDVIKVISDMGEEYVDTAQETGAKTFTLPIQNKLFYRVEVWRHFDQANAMLPAAISNPLYFR